MQVITIIDQPHIANQLMDQLSRFDYVQIAGSYTNPYTGFNHVKRTNIDIVFMNIEMSQLNGLVVAKQLKRENPNIQIVFVTKHNTYAVEAFELGALDYLTLPLEHNRLKNTMNRIYPKLAITNRAEKNYYICCFGGLSVMNKDNNRPLSFRWRTRKTEELFSYLLLNNGKKIRKDYLVNIIWPHFDWYRGISQLYSTIYQIRKTLKSIGVNVVIENLDQYYVLHLNNIELDIDKWEKSIKQLPPISEQTISIYTKFIYEYKGDLFRESGYIWSKKECNRLRDTWLYYVEQVTDLLFKKGKYMEIINIYHHVQVVYSLGVNSYYALMRLYAYLNNNDAVAMQYKALKKMLRDEFDIEPSNEIKKWYALWRNEKGNLLQSTK